ncbi:MAG: N-methyl-L-tryptophan oxidase [Pirellulaceae bacterium]|nr:N-methyl-L-tryptophan oxidase [Pirellulaceae bacterium]
MTACYDCVVIGLGGVGSAVVYQLALGGYRVLGVDQYAPPHMHGSSHGQTRIIRKAYFEHPDYVPLLIRAYELWRQLEGDVGKQLYWPTGLLQVGPADGSVLSGVRRSASTHQLPIQEMTMREAIARFPGVRGPDDWQAILELDAGFLEVEACVSAHLELARRSGAELLPNTHVVAWQVNKHSQGVTVQTVGQRYQAQRLVIAAGPWADNCLGCYRLPLRVLRKYVYWFKVPQSYHFSCGFPCFFYDTPEGYFYGFPDHGGQGFKVARHSGGTPVQTVQGANHPVDVHDRQAVESFLQRYMPDVTRQLAQWQGCYYTMTPDEHFIVDTLPEAPSVVIVAGLSGHGFKFTSVLGEIAAQLVTDRTPTLNTSFLGLQRLLS